MFEPGFPTFVTAEVWWSARQCWLGWGTFVWRPVLDATFHSLWSRIGKQEIGANHGEPTHHFLRHGQFLFFFKTDTSDINSQLVLRGDFVHCRFSSHHWKHFVPGRDFHLRRLGTSEPWPVMNISRPNAGLSRRVRTCTVAIGGFILNFAYGHSAFTVIRSSRWKEVCLIYIDIQ